MRRFDAIWSFQAGALTDRTQTLGDGSATPLALAAGDIIYLGHSDWIAGFYNEPTAYTGPPTYVVEQYFDGSWKILPQQERYDQLTLGYSTAAQGVDLSAPGVIYWGQSQLIHIPATPSATGFPESVAVPDTIERYWYRLRILTGTVTLSRILPRLFNTYATIDEVASFLGVPSFDDIHEPKAEYVRKKIAANENWVDSFTLKTWRLNSAINETYDFNPSGFFLRNRPARVVSSLMIWNGNTFDVFIQGRGRDYWVDPRLGQITFTNTRLRAYSQILGRGTRQPGAVVVNYVYGRDFDTDEKQQLVKDTVLKRTAADLVLQADWTGLLTSGGGSLDTVPKAEKARQWMEESQQTVDELRGLVNV